MSVPLRIAVVGVGRIARDQHLPAIAGDPGFDLVATVDPAGGDGGDVPCFPDVAALAASRIAVDAVALCMPPQARQSVARAAIDRGWHVLLEKPPASTVAEAIAMRDAAAARGVSLFAGWHARFAGGVGPARAWLAGRPVRRVTIDWREDARIWHSGQDWLWEPGGLGVFDPGINALSIATHILPAPLAVDTAELDLPENRAAPIAARLCLRDGRGAPIAVELDFRAAGPPRWEIAVETDGGMLALTRGGAALSIDGVEGSTLHERPGGDYARLYRHFGETVRAGRSDVDLAPLRLVADAFLRARFNRVDPFHW